MLSKSYFSNLMQNLRVADAVDVLVFAAIVYIGLLWFRRARSRFVMLGIVAIVIVYAAARVLDLTLTLVLFQAGLTVALVALVVIFQEEIRRTFERLGNPNALRSKLNNPKLINHDEAAWIDDVVVSTTAMACDKTGALIVIKGEEPLDRHVRGGSVLDGRVSMPLLLSIFDCSSPGHDGAVLIENGGVRAFGVHLPLSTSISGQEPFGTRHSAAIGLSECSDALVLVVSEERGVISIAQDGVLEEAATPAALRDRITTFLSSIGPKPHRTPWWSPITSNFAPKLAALTIALVAWALVVGPQGESVGRSYRVPIATRHAPSFLMLDQPRPSDVLVTLSGAERAFRALHPASLVVTVDGSSVRAGAQRVQLGQGQLELPKGLILQDIDPDTITLVAHDTLDKSFPIDARTTGSLPKGLTLVDVRTKPERVALIVRKSNVGTFTKIETDPIDLNGIKETITAMRPLSIPPGARLAEGEPGSVQIVVEVTRN